VVRDGDVVAVDCVAVGGCPPASVVLRLGRRDVSDLFATSVDLTLSGQRRSMRRVQFSVVKRHRPVAGLTATTAYDGLTLRCLATLPGFGALSVGLRLTVLCKHTPSNLHILHLVLSELLTKNCVNIISWYKLQRLFFYLFNFNSFHYRMSSVHYGF